MTGAKTPFSLLKTVDVLNDVFAAQEALRFEQGEITTALAQSEPADAETRAMIENLHRAVREALCAKHIRARARKQTGRSPIWTENPPGLDDL